MDKQVETLQAHPAAEATRVMDDDEFSGLVESIYADPPWSYADTTLVPHRRGRRAAWAIKLPHRTRQLLANTFAPGSRCGRLLASACTSSRPGRSSAAARSSRR